MLDKSRSSALPTLSEWFDLYHKYDDELRSLARSLRHTAHIMQQSRYGTTFGDVEGECMYILVRESRPEVLFEISPNAGWSTNYILAALTANKQGMLHSFELLSHMRGKPIERVIRDNQCSGWDQNRWYLHVGNAQETVKEVNGQIDFLLLDSCHDDWFAEWYIKELFPRVQGWTLVQDIAFVDVFEPSTEASCLWDWLTEEKISGSLIGQVEVELEKNNMRSGFAERRALRSNSVLLSFPNQFDGMPPQIAESLEQRLEKAEQEIAGGQLEKADTLLNSVIQCLMKDPTRVNRHRLFVSTGDMYQRMGNTNEAERAYRRALGVGVESDLQQRLKSLVELMPAFLGRKCFRLFLQASFLLLFSYKGGLLLLLQTMLRLLGSVLRRMVKLGK